VELKPFLRVRLPAALPTDVRKAYGFPKKNDFLRLRLPSRRSLLFHLDHSGKAKPFRTSGALNKTFQDLQWEGETISAPSVVRTPRARRTHS